MLAIEERVREQGGRLVGWALGASIARRVLGMVNTELDKMSPDGSELRAAFDEWVTPRNHPHGGGPSACRRDRRRHPPGGGARNGAGLAVGPMGAVAHRAGSRCRPTDRSHRRHHRGRAGQPRRHAGSRPGRPGPRAGRGGNRGAARCCPRLKHVCPNSSPRWSPAGTRDDRRRLELRVGKDLQYVRVNGTLVGFLVGGLLYAALRGVFGVAGP